MKIKTTIQDGKITPHFRWSEFFKNQTEDFFLPAETIGSVYMLATLLEALRPTHMKRDGAKGWDITSGCRSKAYNDKVGGIAKSNHRWDIHNEMETNGEPAEIACDNAIPIMKPEDGQFWVTEIQKAANKLGIRVEVGIYTPTSARSGFVHIGINPKYTRGNYNWLKHKGKQTNNYYKNEVWKG